MSASAVRRLLPFLDWPPVTRAGLVADLLAGLAVALLAVPQSLAYAQLAGVPAYYGLYAAFIPSIVGVLFGSSALLSTGPVALTSLLTAAAVSQLQSPGSADFIAYVTLLSLLSGLFQVGLGLARAGALLSLLSHPVLIGFVNGAAVVIAVSQLPALTGIHAPQSGSFVPDFWRLLVGVPSLHPASLALGALAIALLLLFRRFAPRAPGVLIMVALLTTVSYATGFGERGGAIVGAIPGGLPSLSLPALNWQATVSLLPAAFVIALVSFMEAMSSCKVIAIKTRTRWDENQELIGQGLAKVAAAFCNSMPVSGSFSRSALILAAQGRSGWSSLFAAGIVLLTLLAFTPALHHLPKPALAAMIVLAVVGLIDLPAMRSAWRASRDDGLAALLTFGATLAFAPDIQIGIVVGIVFSLGAFIFRRMVPRVVLLGRHPDGSLRDADAHGLPPPHERISALRFDAALFFANAKFFEDMVLRLQSDRPELRYILVAASGINHLDASGVETLRTLVRHLRDSGITLAFSGAKQQILDVMRRTGLQAEIGDDNFYDADAPALAALIARLDKPATP